MGGRCDQTPHGRNAHGGASEQRVAVFGVVIAGILVSFAAPGPYSWASTLIGLVLLGVLFGYGGGWPEESPETVGFAAAVAFTVVLTLGLPLEFIVDRLSSHDYVLSAWTENTRPGDDIPLRSDGLGTFVATLVVFLVQLAWWKRKSRGAAGQH